MSFDYVHHRPEGPHRTVALTKNDPWVALTDEESESGILRVNLNWTARPPEKAGIFAKGRPPIDLDLGCFYEHADGSKGAVHAVGKRFTDEHTFGGDPLIRLDGDDRSGREAGGENLFIDLTDPSRIKRILVFAHIYEGVPYWAGADGVVTVYPASGRRFKLQLIDGDRDTRICGVAMIVNDEGRLTINRKVRYATNHRELDDVFGWGLEWHRARKDEPRKD